MTVSTGRQPLGGRFWTLLASSAFSNLADGVIKAVLPLIAVRLTDSPILVSGVLVALTLPWLFFALPVGVLVDSVDRRFAMLVADALRVAVLSVLAAVIALDSGSIWTLYVAAFVLGLAETVYDTAAQSLLPSVVDHESLERANGRLSAAEISTNLFAGPPLGGLLVGSVVILGVSGPAGLWGVAFVAMLLLRGDFKPRRSTKFNWRGEFFDGARFVWENRLLQTMALMASVCNIATSAFLATFVVHAVGLDSAMRLNDVQYGFLLAAAGVGSLLGSLMAGWAGSTFGRGRLLMATIVGMSIFVGAPSFTASYAAVLLAFFVGGAAVAAWNVVTVSFRQRVTPDALLGRVNSFYRLLTWGTLPLGALLGGVLGELAGMQPMFASMAVLMLLSLAGIRVVNEANMRQAVGEP